ncbi:sigma-54-dependent transcriptional regulator [Cognaticolwellia mytili]|uniref:sigma-54-dependent transcriptional regulator n=1 Tax=Cognaticolwellia mytili TaxID=1888913 RepID=UPI000A1782B5|nr:sigma-54 dependent transcriptional regulator [Cognaticolwellia mytili]
MKQTILLIDDDQDILAALKMLLSSEGFAIKLAQTPQAATALLAKESIDLVLTDLNFTRDTTSGDEGIQLIAAIRKLDEQVPVVVMTGWATIDVAVTTMQHGANDFIQKPWDIDRLIAIINNLLKLASVEKKSQQLSQQNNLLQQQINKEFDGDVITKSPAMKQTMSIIQHVAKSNANILLTGENGTGKSMFARYIHQHSQRAGNEQISVNMGSVTETLFESEMFGHIKGAFTDAKANRIGRFELADNGTLFLDEIANTPYSQQAKLLRVLEDREFEKVGANKTQLVNVRLISATNANLTEAVADGKFRKDLFYRINTIAIEIPPLRDRVEDIIPLAKSFLMNHRLNEISLSQEAKNALMTYSWPGNIRELSHVIERALILCQNATIAVSDLGLPAELMKSKQSKAEKQNDIKLTEHASLASLEEIELDIIDKRLTHFNGNALKAAKSLGLSRSAFYRRLDKIQNQFEK